MQDEVRDHYEEVQRQSLQRLRGEIVGYFGHELSEMVIELSGDNPNVDFSLNRVKRLQRFMERLQAREF